MMHFRTFGQITVINLAARCGKLFHPFLPFRLPTLSTVNPNFTEQMLIVV